MKKFMTWLSEVFAPKMNEVFSRPWISAISSSMQKIIPFILTGSIIFLYNVFADFLPLPDISPIATYSFGIMSLIVAYVITSQCMEKLGHPQYVMNGGITSLGVFLMVATPKGEAADSLSAFMGNIGPAGIAVGMIVGLVVAAVFNIFGKIRLLKNSSVPDFIVSWIDTILPAIICLGVAMVFTFNLNTDLYAVIQSIFTPIASIGQTLPGFLLLCFIPAFFYTMGISSWTWGAVTTPIYMAGIQANIDAVAAGLPATNIVTSETVFTLAFITMGGMCCTLALNILMCFSKSKQLKTLGRVFIIPSIANINEPVMFGAPVVFNPILMLPAWISTIVGTIYVWILMSTGLLNIPSKMIQVGQIPAPITSVMITEDMRAILWWVILLAIYLIIWYPFFKTFEKQKLAEEKAELQGAAE